VESIDAKNECTKSRDTVPLRRADDLKVGFQTVSMGLLNNEKTHKKL
jgi:hypothetical protein